MTDNFSNNDLFLKSTGPITSSNPVGGVGYTADATGGAVTQGTSRATAVTCNGMTGAITVFSASQAAAATVAITINNTSVKTGDVIIVNHTSGGTIGAYAFTGNTIVNATSFKINITNISGGTLSEAPVLAFAIIRAPRA
jgi:hypothetical protein